MTKLTEQQKQIARETFDKERAMCGWSHPRELYAAVAAVLEQQGWPTDAECRADAPGGPLAQRTPAPAPCVHDWNLEYTPTCCRRCGIAVTDSQPAPAPQSTDGEDTDDDIWEHNSEMVETIRCTICGDETVMTRKQFAAALTEARRGMYSADEIEKAIRAEWARAEMSQVYFIAAVLARLSAKEQPII